jgi:hypothetical protein
VLWGDSPVVDLSVVNVVIMELLEGIKGWMLKSMPEDKLVKAGAAATSLN